MIIFTRIPALTRFPAPQYGIKSQRLFRFAGKFLHPDPPGIPYVPSSGIIQTVPTKRLPTMASAVAIGVAIGRDPSGNPVDIWGNRTSVPGRVAPTVITYPSQIPAQGNQPPVVITVNPPVSLTTPPITRKNILAMPQGVTNDTLTKLIGLNDSIKNMNIYQTLKVSSRSV